MSSMSLLVTLKGIFKKILIFIVASIHLKKSLCSLFNLHLFFVSSTLQFAMFSIFETAFKKHIISV